MLFPTEKGQQAHEPRTDEEEHDGPVATSSRAETMEILIRLPSTRPLRAERVWAGCAMPAIPRHLWSSCWRSKNMRSRIRLLSPFYPLLLCFET